MDKISLAFEKSGGAQELANALGVSVQRVVNWRIRGRIPPEWVIPVCRHSRGSVTPHDLNPEIYPCPDWVPPEITSNHAS